MEVHPTLNCIRAIEQMLFPVATCIAGQLLQPYLLYHTSRLPRLLPLHHSCSPSGLAEFTTTQWRSQPKYFGGEHFDFESEQQ